MQGDRWLRLAWWWNRSWGTMTRRDVWLEQNRDTNVFRIRTRWGQDPENSMTMHSASFAIASLKQILGEDKGHWDEHVYLDEFGTLWRYDRPLEKVDLDD